MSTIKIKSSQKKNDVKQLALKEIEAEEEKKELRRLEILIKADRTKSLLENVSIKMDALNIDSFDTLFPELLGKMKEATILREELLKEIGSEEIIKIRPELFSIAKQIENKFDSLVEKYKLEAQSIQKELSTIGNKKKITNYLR